MLLLMRAGKEVPIEPAIFNELAAVGIWDQQPFLNMLKDHAFEFVVTYEQDFKRFTPEMLQEIERNYPIAETVGPFLPSMRCSIMLSSLVASAVNLAAGPSSA